MKIQIYGTGCPKCKQLEANARQAFPQAQVEKVSDMDKIVDAGVMMTPAIGIDGKVLKEGKLLSPDEIRKLVK